MRLLASTALGIILHIKVQKHDSRSMLAAVQALYNLRSSASWYASCSAAVCVNNHLSGICAAIDCRVIYMALCVLSSVAGPG